MRRTSLLLTPATLALLSVLFLIASQATQAQTEKVLYSFCSEGVPTFCPDGEMPTGTLAVDSNGNLYGTTNYGGANNYGAVFELIPKPATGCPPGFNTGNGWCESVLYSFCAVAKCADGAYPEFASLVLDSSGNLYGTTSQGGLWNVSNSSCPSAIACGTVFELSPEPAGGCPSGTNPGYLWCESVLYNFCNFSNCSDGESPRGGLTWNFTSGAHLYGVNGAGIFELTRDHFGIWISDLVYPDTELLGGVVFDSAGNMYAADQNTVDEFGQGANYGHVFKLSFVNGGWVLGNWLAFTGTPDGEFPNAPPALDSADNIYGTTFVGGKSNEGTVWKMTKVTKGIDIGGYKKRILHNFTSDKTGFYPNGGVTLDSAGDIYGTATEGGKYYPPTTGGGGIVFELAVSATGYTYKTLWNFNGPDGDGPVGNLIPNGAGNLYGVTQFGGAFGTYGSICSFNPPCGGTVFEVTP